MNPDIVQSPPINRISLIGGLEIACPRNQRPIPTPRSTPLAHRFEMNQNTTIIPIRTTMLIAM